MARFNTRFTETIKMITRTGDSYVDGRYQKGAEVSIDIVASVQRLNMRDRELLPEGFRAAETYKIFTEYDPLQIIIDNDPVLVEAAEFEYRGNRFAMLASEKWDYLIPHWKTTVVKKEDQP